MLSLCFYIDLFSVSIAEKVGVNLLNSLTSSEETACIPASYVIFFFYFKWSIYVDLIFS